MPPPKKHSNFLYVNYSMVTHRHMLFDYKSDTQSLLTGGQKTETQLVPSWLLMRHATTSKDPPLAKMSHLPRSFSSRKKSKRCCLGTGIQTDVEALSTTPEGSPGSFMLTRLITHTSAAKAPTCNVSHRREDERQRPEQNLLLMRLVSFKMLLLPSRAITRTAAIKEMQ